MTAITLTEIKTTLNNSPRPPKIRELARLMGVADTDYRSFRRQVREAIQNGDIERLRGGRLVVPSSAGKVKGRLLVARSGIGFVVPDDSSDEVFIAENELGGALHGETVIVELKKFRLGKSREGRIVRVLGRNGTQLVGKLERSPFGWRLTPGDPRIAVKIELSGVDGFRVKPDYIVVVRLDEWTADYLPPRGRIVEVLGPAGSPGVDIDALVKSSGLPVEFTAAALAETKKIRKNLSARELSGRIDLRELTVFTIDPADAKDHDDAVSYEELKTGGVRLGVHIADVSHYVPAGSQLDREALLRGNSIYLVDRVIPMLPQKLSADLCSLHEGEERLTLSVLIDFDRRGNIVKHEIVESIIRSRASLNYHEVQKCLDGKPSPELMPYSELLQKMNALAGRLRTARLAAGSLDFDLPEPKLVLDKEGNVVDIFRHPRYDSHRLIEEFMLVANRLVAKTMAGMAAPVLYRVHDKPDKLKINSLAELLKDLGYNFSFRGEITPKKVQRVLEQATGHKDEEFVHRLLLRSLAKAVYQPVNIGHFGLAFDIYGHFTSPIRRYPDLHLHRVIKLHLHRRLNSQTAAPIREALKNIGLHCSSTELQADGLERESIKIKFVEYFAGQIGSTFKGTVSGVVRTGLFVEIDELLAEGFLSFSSLGDDYYIFDQGKHQAIGRNNKKRFRLGDPIEVIVVKVDRERREIEFYPAQTAGPRAGKKRH